MHGSVAEGVSGDARVACDLPFTLFELSKHYICDAGLDLEGRYDDPGPSDVLHPAEPGLAAHELGSDCLDRLERPPRDRESLLVEASIAVKQPNELALAMLERRRIRSPALLTCDFEYDSSEWSNSLMGRATIPEEARGGRRSG
jgi:hypothetical protein